MHACAWVCIDACDICVSQSAALFLLLSHLKKIPNGREIEDVDLSLVWQMFACALHSIKSQNSWQTPVPRVATVLLSTSKPSPTQSHGVTSAHGGHRQHRPLLLPSTVLGWIHWNQPTTIAELHCYHNENASFLIFQENVKWHEDKEEKLKISFKISRVVYF